MALTIATRKCGRLTFTVRLALVAFVLVLAGLAAPACGQADESTADKINYTPLARSLVRYSQNPVMTVGEKGA